MLEFNHGADYQRNRQEYDSFWSSRWRRYWTYSTQTKLRRFRHLMDRHDLLNRDGLAVFDMGFGLGAMLFAFRPSCRLAGVELSPTTVLQAQAIAQRRRQTADFRTLAPGENYPIEWLGAFDVVISSHVLEHIHEPRPVLLSLMKLLRPHGVACIVVPINEKPGDDLNHFHCFTEHSFRQMLEDENLEIISIQCCDRLYRLMMPIARRRQKGPCIWARIASIILNAVLAPLPYFGLCMADKIMSCPPTQCFALVRQRQNS